MTVQKEQVMEPRTAWTDDEVTTLTDYLGSGMAQAAGVSIQELTGRIATLDHALRRAIAMAHFLGDSVVHVTKDWTDCDAPVCAEARAALRESDRG